MPLNSFEVAVTACIAITLGALVISAVTSDELVENKSRLHETACMAAICAVALIGAQALVAF